MFWKSLLRDEKLKFQAVEPRRLRVETMTDNISRMPADMSEPGFNLATVAAGLPAAELISGLRDSHIAGSPLRAVVVAPPGTGKTTVVPPTLANRLLGLEIGRASCRERG